MYISLLSSRPMTTTTTQRSRKKKDSKSFFGGKMKTETVSLHVFKMVDNHNKIQVWSTFNNNRYANMIFLFNHVIILCVTLFVSCAASDIYFFSFNFSRHFVRDTTFERREKKNVMTNDFRSGIITIVSTIIICSHFFFFLLSNVSSFPIHCKFQMSS